MDIILDKKSATQASIKVKLIEADYQPKVEEKIKEYSKKANIKGFRPGKVPAGVIRRMYGKGILVEEINSILSGSLRKYIEDEKLEILGEPLPNHEAADKIDWDSQKDFEFEYDLGLVDDFKVSLDKKVTQYNIKVDDKILDETIANVAKQNGTTEQPDESAATDSLLGKLKSEDGAIERDAYIVITDLEKTEGKKFIGLKKGDTVEFTMEKAIKDAEKKAQMLGMNTEDAQAIKGKFSYTVDNITRTIPAEMNQDFFDKVFGKDAVKDEEAFREKVRSTVEENYQRETENLLNRDIQKTLIEHTKIELPDEFLKRWLKASNEKVTDEDIAKEYDLYTNDLRWNLIKNKIASENEIKVEHTDIMEETKSMIREQFGAMGMSEQLEANLDSFADNYLKAEDGKNYMKIFEQLRDKRVLEVIRGKIEIKSKNTDLDGFRKAVEN